jgi:hypothetical protein
MHIPISRHFMSLLRIFCSNISPGSPRPHGHEVTAWQFQWQCSGGLPWSSSPLRRNSSSAEPWWPYHNLNGSQASAPKSVNTAKLACSQICFCRPGLSQFGRVEPLIPSLCCATAECPLWQDAVPNGEPWTKWRGGSIMGSRPKKCMPLPSMPAATASAHFPKFRRDQGLTKSGRALMTNIGGLG